MTSYEWMAGFVTIIEIAVMVILLHYLYSRWATRYTAAYCAAFSIWLYILGNATTSALLWYVLFRHPELHTFAAIEDFSPIAGSPLYWVGMTVISTALVQTLYTYGVAYFNIYYLIITIIAVAAVCPLFSLWF
jgi:hypothetical protein